MCLFANTKWAHRNTYMRVYPIGDNRISGLSSSFTITKRDRKATKMKRKSWNVHWPCKWGDDEHGPSLNQWKRHNEHVDELYLWDEFEITGQGGGGITITEFTRKRERNSSNRRGKIELMPGNHRQCIPLGVDLPDRYWLGSTNGIGPLYLSPWHKWTTVEDRQLEGVW